MIIEIVEVEDIVQIFGVFLLNHHRKIMLFWEAAPKSLRLPSEEFIQIPVLNLFLSFFFFSMN